MKYVISEDDFYEMLQGNEEKLKLALEGIKGPLGYMTLELDGDMYIRCPAKHLTEDKFEWDDSIDFSKYKMENQNDQ